MFKKSYELHTFDFDPNKSLKITTLLNFLQDISTVHYNSVAGGECPHAVWVIVEWALKINSNLYLNPTSNIQVTTRPTYFRKFIAYREYELRNENKELLGTAISKWAFINYKSRSQENIPRHFNELFNVIENSYKPQKLEGMDFKLIKPMKKSFMSQFSDIDVNRHVNNVSYLRWIMDSVPYEYHEKNYIKELKIVYKKEVLKNQAISVETEIIDKVTHHIVTNENGEECVRVKMLW